MQCTNYGGTASLAYYEMRVILARFLYNFDLELCSRNENWIQQKCWMIWEKGPLKIRINLREG